MPFDIYNKEFQNWLKGVFGLNTTRTALCECISDKLDNVLRKYSHEELHQYFLCLKANNISLLNTKSKGSTDKRWECEHESCSDIMRYFIDNHKQEHKLKYTWAPLGKSEIHGTAGVGYHCKELKWNVIKLYMHVENEDVMKQCTSLDCLDITHVIKIMRNCKLISTNDLDEPLDEVLASRNKFMHSPDNKMTDNETSNTIHYTRKLLDCLDIAEKTYYKNAAQELHDLSENDFVVKYQSEECKRILADVKDAKQLADELNSAIKEDNLSAKSQSKRLQYTLERIAGLWSTSTTNTRLEMKPAEYKRMSKEFLEKKVDAIKLDQKEYDENTAEHKEMEDLKERTERDVKEVIKQMHKLEPVEMVDEIEKLRKENESLKYVRKLEIGTLRPAANFDPVEVSCSLKEAMNGDFTYQKAINILACITNSQRQDIIKTFKRDYGEDLIMEFTMMLGRRSMDLINGLMMLPEEFDVCELIRTEPEAEDTLIEILCSRNNAQIQKINEAYHRMCGQELKYGITHCVQDHLYRLMVSLAKYLQFGPKTQRRRHSPYYIDIQCHHRTVKWGQDTPETAEVKELLSQQKNNTKPCNIKSHQKFI